MTLASLRRWTTRVFNWFRSDRLDRDLAAELEHHLELATEEYMQRGLSEPDARRAAQRALGNTTRLREQARESRGLPLLDLFVLDARLSLRVARRHWGVSIVAGLAMTVAITLAVVVFAFVQVAFGGKLPLDEGHRIVALQIWDEESQSGARTTVHHLEHWQERVRGLEDLGAFRTVRRNLILGDGDGLSDVEPVVVAEMTATGFALARVRPFLGRTLQAADERPGAESVVVLGHHEWSQRFDADPGILGRSLRLGDRVHTIVGVMPDGFRFPASHSFWAPLPTESGQLQSSAAEVHIFARLPATRSVEQVEAELAAAGFGSVAESGLPSEERLRVRAAPYALALTMSEVTDSQVDFAVRMLMLAGLLLLAPPSLNVAILVYARLVTRHREFKTRQALGASRRRILAQLFLEMLVLSLGAATVALLIASTALRWFGARLAQETPDGMPFWMDFSLGAESVGFALLLAAAAALMAGVLPGLGATRPDRQGGFRISRSDGPGLGRTWNVLVALQIGVCLAALPATLELAWGTARNAVLGPGFDAEDILTATVSLDDDPFADGETQTPSQTPSGRIVVPGREDSDRRQDFIRRLQREPGVATASFATPPGTEPWVRVEFVPAGDPSASNDAAGVEAVGSRRAAHRMLARTGRVDAGFRETLSLERIAGSWFADGDFGHSGHSVVVSEAFARMLGSDVSLLGGRLRYLPAEGAAEAAAEPEWYEVVGVVANRPLHEEFGTIFHPVEVSTAPPQLLIRLAPGTELGEQRLRELAAQTHPNLRVEKVQTLAAIYREQQVGNYIGLGAVVAITLSALLLAAAGVYALMSFTVQQQRREIAIRTSLGASQAHLLGSMLRRAFTRLLVGGVLGIGAAVALDLALPAERFGGWTIPAVVPATTVLLLGLGLLTAVLPARRGLEIDPVVELKEG